MSKKPKEIKLGQLYLNRGEYSRVIRLLEPKVPLFLENKDFYPILGKAFFYTGDYAGSKLYFDRGQKIHWDIESSLYLAVLGLKRRDFNSAIRIWLDILDEDPSNKIAQKGLTTLKKYSTMDDLESFIHSKKLDKLVPRKLLLPTRGTIVSLIIVSVLVLFSVLFVKLDLAEHFINLNISKNNLNEDRVGVMDFSLESLDKNYLDFEKQSIYTFSSAQIEEYFKTASLLFKQEKDNLVLSYLNLIKYSNANETIKKKAELLSGYLVEPEWTSYSDEIEYFDVANNIYQYEGCIVKWKGRLSNLEIKDKKIHFSFLVGYENGKVLDGVIPVELNENVKIQENQPIEVLGKVVLRNNTFYLEAKTVMQYIVKN
ncbi:hypothetical protein EW093_14225 [Thiospirochaeta perfilievii]|uniref:Tetratricopeptide repeat protein n=1 Tax=Thiospirochaeta perfilievii TaxID=252967 RepID=A0A5C1QFH9_9SPIO|nr:hypothetical protein [Thiospirochaeta perfilievii]QEN05809.1 hypothetical protein EW093_14225 [Thiospirochaeta perfilievii]